MDNDESNERVPNNSSRPANSSGIADNDSVPVDIERLATAANAKVKVAYDLADDESGQTTWYKGSHVIIVNGNHREERQRFTVLHEISCLNCPRSTTARR